MTPPDDSEVEEEVELERVTGDITRLTYLTDAAVAISLTLLFLPVVEIIRKNQQLSWSDLISNTASDLNSLIV